MPVIVGALGIIKKGTNKYINKIPSNPSRYEIEKNYILQNCLYPLESTFNVTKNITQKRLQKIIDRMNIVTTFPHPRSWVKTW